MENLVAVDVVDPSRARAVVAHFILGAESETEVRVGSITLKAHQRSAVARIRAALAEFGGALLADPVGTGKTFIALAVAGAGRRVLIAAPAVLKDMWKQSAAACGVCSDFVSIEALSRGTTVTSQFDLLVVDEAHHCRNAATRRYESLSRLASLAPVLLLTATPIHNRRKDLASLLALFSGQRAQSLSDSELARCVIRRTDLSHGLDGIPHIDTLVWCTIADEPRMAKLLLSLPPPLPTRDGGDGGSLVIHSLIRQWSSSNAALAGGLKRRLARAEALIAALHDGTWPSRAELLSWISGDDAIQLSFPEMLAPRSTSARQMLPVVVAHRDAVRRILDECRRDLSDTARAGLIRQLRKAHSDRRIVLFSQFADTVNGMFDLLVADGGIAALSGSGARVAGGTISRLDALRCFAPRANASAPPRRAQAITLLLTTDLLSEGVNLQDAGVVIHLDLPWTPARMEQRLGRIARLGSRHAQVVSYAVHPPASSADLVRIESILKRKMTEAEIVTTEFPSLAVWSPAGLQSPTPSMLAESVRTILVEWLEPNLPTPVNECIAATVRSRLTGFVAVCQRERRVFLVGGMGAEISEDPTVLADLLRHCNGPRAGSETKAIHEVIARLNSWLAMKDALPRVARYSQRVAGIRESALLRIDRAIRKARVHDRVRVVALAKQARSLLEGELSAHAEREIASIQSRSVSDDDFLRSIGSMETTKSSDGSASGSRVFALIRLKGD